jgi:hypothetical protein
MVIARNDEFVESDVAISGKRNRQGSDGLCYEIQKII